jgi:hypothetical protein
LGESEELELIIITTRTIITLLLSVCLASHSADPYLRRHRLHQRHPPAHLIWARPSLVSAIITLISIATNTTTFRRLYGLVPSWRLQQQLPLWPVVAKADPFRLLQPAISPSKKIK